MALDAASRQLIVAGDVVIDHHLYTGERGSPAVRDRRGVCEIHERGGAHLLHRLIARLFELDTQRQGDSTRTTWTAKLGVVPPPVNATPAGHDSYAVWQPYPSGFGTAANAQDVWRVSQLMGYGHLTVNNAARLHAPAARALPDPDLLILDDASFLFRYATGHASWALAERGGGFVLLKMSEPVAQGALWQSLIDSCADRLVCLVAAQDLRRETLGLGRGLSWEATLDDLRLALCNHPTAHRLMDCRHLVVTFSFDAALWLDLTNRTAPLAHFCFDPTRAEGEWEAQFRGGAIGFHTAMAATLAMGLADATEAGKEPVPIDLLPGIEAGLIAMRDLKAYGHGPVNDTMPSGYPVDRIAAKILDVREGKLDPRERLARTEIAWPPNPATADPTWSIVEASQHGGGKGHSPLLGLASNVAQRGATALDGLPHARFGKLVTADRVEIETLRHIRGIMRAYRDDLRPKRPLCIGVFGPPGAGKSFGVGQVAEEVFGERSWREFNLSQFRDSPDLNGAFHQVRDLALAGLTPVVLWDEVDSRELHWLQFLLAPMQDGRFQDGQLNHAIGKCVFIFAGGTSSTFAEFTSPAEKNLEAFRLHKGPDFVSRLDAHMDVLGPNPRSVLTHSGTREVDSNDIGFPVRRALLIRAYLGCGAVEAVDFDPNLLHALLCIDQYRHGARSLEKLMQLLRGTDGRTVRRSSLPRPAQLDMHVDAEQFDNLMQGEEVAAAIHETWRALAREEGWSMHGHLDKPYAELMEDDKDDNRAAARRIPAVLALAGLELRRAGEGLERAVPEAELRSSLEQNLEHMAEAEHDGWMAYRASNGWQFAEERCDAQKLHPAMLPFTKLPEHEKGKDRNSIRHYPDFVTRANHRIVRVVPHGSPSTDVGSGSSEANR